MTTADAQGWFGATPPDLSVDRALARRRLAVHLPAQLLPRRRRRPTGWNNLVFPNVGMPHVLWELQGQQARRHRVQGPHEAQGARSPPSSWSGGALPAQAAVETSRATPGTLTPVEYDALVADLVNYLDFMGEPAKNQRISSASSC